MSIPLVRRIGQLPPSVVNKIAAGEVIERPASVVKELLENAVDAGATRIEVTLESGGLDRIRVSDNGCGIPPDDLLLAVASHATSKIQNADDLFAVATLGFRGEALASIAEVSQFSLRTRVADLTMGHELVVNGGEIKSPEPCASPVGTTIDVRNLFFNTPVRRKFMRGTSTELGHGTEAFQRIALAFPRVHFVLRHNDRVLHDLPPVDNWRDRIASLFGRELAESLMAIESEDHSVQLTGFVANPTHSRSNNKMQYLFLNGRHIRDRSLQHALGEAYRGLLLTGRFPIVFLRMEMPADQIDVNVHPTKLEVRFQDAGRVYSHLLSTIRSRFLSSDLTARVQPLSDEGVGSDRLPLGGMAMGSDEEAIEQVRQRVSEWARTGGSTPASVVPAAPADSHRQAAFRFDQRSDEFRPFPALPHQGVAGAELRRASVAAEAASWSPDATFSRSLSDSETGSQADAGDEPWAPRENSGTAAAPIAVPTRMGDGSIEPVGDTGWQPRTVAFQAHNKYLVAPCEEGVMVIDQHALHERILYEQFREKTLAQAVEIQRLLVPETVDLAPSEAAAVLEYRQTLADIGILVEPFGGSTILVQGYPAMLGRVQPAELLRQVAAQIVTNERPLQRRDVLDELLHMMSCKAAIKTGDRLSQEEIGALLEHRHLVQDSHHCPHGRPTTLVFTREELDKRFKRI